MSVVEEAGSGFEGLSLSQRMLATLERVGYEQPTDIQAALIPLAMEGRDCTGQARTGTGKTASFVIPILERIDHDQQTVQALILCPTRELSEQVASEATRLAQKHDTEPVLLVGGRPLRGQLAALRRNPTIAIGTPGRVIDHLRRGTLNVRQLKIAVLDEADRMLDIGFRPDIERILRQCPRQRQTLLLSATMPPPVERLAQRYMQDPVRVDLSQDSVATDLVEQFYCTVDADRKFGLLVRLLLEERPQQAIVFRRTKKGADQLHNRLKRRLPRVAAIHGDLPQAVRDRVMKQFREGKIRLLIATDVMGRGIDVSGISHIINYDVPEYCDDYVHRVGRTGRISSDRPGRAFTFATKEEGTQLTRIEMRINQLLNEYKLDEFEAYRPRGPRPHVDDHPQPRDRELPEFQIV
jgi:ATP-dependent RNA helicase DeaD